MTDDEYKQAAARQLSEKRQLEIKLAEIEMKKLQVNSPSQSGDTADETEYVEPDYRVLSHYQPAVDPSKPILTDYQRRTMPAVWMAMFGSDAGCGLAVDQLLDVGRVIK
jgi:hypothetical protein